MAIIPAISATTALFGPPEVPMTEDAKVISLPNSANQFEGIVCFGLLYAVETSQLCNFDLRLVLL